MERVHRAIAKHDRAHSRGTKQMGRLVSLGGKDWEGIQCRGREREVRAVTARKR